MTEQKKPRNPLALIRHYIDYYKELAIERNTGEKTREIEEIRIKLRLLSILESDMEIEYFPLGDQTTLDGIRKGAVFATEDGVYATKTEYKYGDEAGSQWMCILLESGEFAHFPDKNKTIVYEVIQPRQREL